MVLDKSGMRKLADTLGESPRACASLSLLRRGLCRAAVVGSPDVFTAAIVQFPFMSDEPIAFGEDIDGIVALLDQTELPWGCVEVHPDIAEPLGDLVQSHWDRKIRLYDAVYLALLSPARSIRNAEVRLLTHDDLELWSGVSDDELEACGFGDVETHLREGIAAAAIVNGRIVAVTECSGITGTYADVGVYTQEPYRRRGYASAGASLVSTEAQRRQLVPVWSTGVDNHASLGIAAKVGFTEAERATYVIRLDEAC